MSQTTFECSVTVPAGLLSSTRNAGRRHGQGPLHRDSLLSLLQIQPPAFLYTAQPPVLAATSESDSEQIRLDIDNRGGITSQRPPRSIRVVRRDPVSSWPHHGNNGDWEACSPFELGDHPEHTYEEDLEQKIKVEPACSRKQQKCITSKATILDIIDSVLKLLQEDE